MKNQVPFLSGLLVLWIVGGSLLYRFLCCGTPGSALTIKDGSQTIANAKENVFFAFNGIVPTIPETAENAFESVAIYLSQHPEKVLAVTGSYSDDEKMEQLGDSRSQSLIPKLESLNLDQKQLIFKSKPLDGVLLEGNNVYNAIQAEIIDIPNYALSLNHDDSGFNVSAKKNLIFEHSGYEIETPIDPSVQNFFGELSTLLKNNANRKLVIEGLYASSEANTSILPDLGLARATSIKNLLQSLDVPSDQIELGTKQNEELIFPGNLLYGGALYRIEAISEAETKELEKEINLIEDELKEKSITLYFETNENTLDLDIEQREFFAKLIRYLDSKEKGRVNVVGHTDNTGKTAYNQQLSEKRADFIKKYLIKNGLNAGQIVTVGKGAKKPIGSNNDEAGRSKNRRVEISIQ